MICLRINAAGDNMNLNGLIKKSLITLSRRADVLLTCYANERLHECSLQF
jgi:hypothetical protein